MSYEPDSEVAYCGFRPRSQQWLACGGLSPHFPFNGSGSLEVGSIPAPVYGGPL